MARGAAGARAEQPGEQPDAPHGNARRRAGGRRRAAARARRRGCGGERGARRRAPPGSDAWEAFESRQRLLLELLDGFDALLTREPSLARYAEGVELRAETDEVLVTGRSQYAQLLGALRGLHSTLAASPLLQHTFEFELLDDDGDGGAPPTEARVAWRYALQGAGSGARVATLEATSAFELEADGDNGLVVARHKLRELQLNGRAALPAPLLRQLRRAQADAPELVKLLSAALLVVSDRGLARPPRRGRRPPPPPPRRARRRRSLRRATCVCSSRCTRSCRYC